MSTKSEPIRRRRLRPLRLTARDERVVRLVAELGATTVAQVQLLEFGERNRSRAQTRLGLLRQAGFLETLPGRAPNEPAVYLVSRRGQRALGLDEDAERAPLRRVAYGRLRHDLAVNDCRVHLLRAARKPGVTMVRWLPEDALRKVTLAHGLVPDAFFQVARQAGDLSPQSSFFLEVEVSEKGERALRQKLTNLGAYYYGGRFEQDFGTRALRVLVLVKPEPGASGERLVQRMTGLGKLVGVTFLRVAELNVFLAVPPPELFRRPIWSQPGVDAPVALFPGGEAHEQRAA
ncbi:MAG: replication-relaxation family protein [Dehalococcoidia bacterium]